MAENNANNRSILGPNTEVEKQEVAETQQQEQLINIPDETDMDVQNNKVGINRKMDGKNTNRNIEGEAPLIVFIGPANCGKSMVLMSLVEYLRELSGYGIETNERYLSTGDYKENCRKFKTILTDNVTKESSKQRLALPGTVNEIMVDISERNVLKCRMLEVPGEDFFKYDERDKKAEPMAPYLSEIFSKKRLSKFPVYFVMLLDLHTNNEEFLTDKTKRSAYEERLIEIYENGFDEERGDRIVLLYNKFDERHKELYKEDEEYLRDLLEKYSKVKDKFSRKILRYSIPKYEVLSYVSGTNFTRDEVETINDKREIVKVEVKWYNQDKDTINSAKELWRCLTKKKWQIWL